MHSLQFQRFGTNCFSFLCRNVPQIVLVFGTVVNFQFYNRLHATDCFSSTRIGRLTGFSDRQFVSVLTCFVFLLTSLGCLQKFTSFDKRIALMLKKQASSKSFARRRSITTQVRCLHTCWLSTLENVERTCKHMFISAEKLHVRWVLGKRTCRTCGTLHV